MPVVSPNDVARRLRGLALSKNRILYSGSIRNLEAKGFSQLYLKRVFSWGLEG